MLGLLLGKGMRMTEADDTWRVLFSEIANGWFQAPDEKILQLETISTLLVAKENREAIGTTFWDLLVDTVSGDWLSGPIGLQKALKTKMSLLLETVSEFQPAYGEKSLRCNNK